MAHGIDKRMKTMRLVSTDDYLEYLKTWPEEIYRLASAMTVSVSRFFRNGMTFEYIEAKVLPDILLPKFSFGKGCQKFAKPSIRVWSAGCAKGEEPYSIAIQIKEFLEKNRITADVNIFATDNNGEMIEQAKKAVYPVESIHDVKYGLKQKYFTSRGKSVILNPHITKQVEFSVYDMTDPKTYVPPESVFGNFDRCYAGIFSSIIMKIYRKSFSQSCIAHWPETDIWFWESLKFPLLNFVHISFRNSIAVVFIESVIQGKGRIKSQPEFKTNFNNLLSMALSMTITMKYLSKPFLFQIYWRHL